MEARNKQTARTIMKEKNGNIGRNSSKCNGGGSSRNTKISSSGNRSSSINSRRIKELLSCPSSSSPSAAAESETEDPAGADTSKNALRERTRVENLRRAYLELQAAIPSVPLNTKLSKLDVLVLATTYISHLSQLLEEDDARVSHDTNNNTMTTTTSLKTAAHGHHTHLQTQVDTHIHAQAHAHAHTHTQAHTRIQTDAHTNSVSMASGPRRITQKGFLHPVKKWPMRARLYAGVGASEAVTFLSEQLPVPVPHFHDKLDPAHMITHAHVPGPHPLPQVPLVVQHAYATSTNSKTQDSLVNIGSTNMVPGVFMEEVGCSADNSYSYPYIRARGPEEREASLCPQAYPTSHMEVWEAGGSWDSNSTCDDPASCQAPCRIGQPYMGYTGHLTAWDE
nr:uncharacterized protein LOC128695842 [Cherax quadricarinatus]